MAGTGQFDGDKNRTESAVHGRAKHSMAAKWSSHRRIRRSIRVAFEIGGSLRMAFENACLIRVALI